MFTSWRSLLSWKPLKIEGHRRAADRMEPEEMIDLTTPEEEQRVMQPLPDGNNGIYSCPICLDCPEAAVTTKCGHVFCKECLIKALSQSQTCPICKKFSITFIRLYT
ncbi:E3 ubiquitin-protein ligase complex SLX5-SLX8 subunit SLX8 [Drosophila eugracilis]|uniref:E3 ubiquitin-protein ligase complex SLX5-SLX8 subunit SLX8 n=1 Tax=Drosophila eugracilis TaxID=29029 RepID=UPI0007E63EEA|nr:E3 ubiquitin-protein ligase complex SLX5-SLX8 subunit SLX8 [Drosophila eugracilis]